MFKCVLEFFNFWLVRLVILLLIRVIFELLIMFLSLEWINSIFILFMRDYIVVYIVYRCVVLWFKCYSYLY